MCKECGVKQYESFEELPQELKDKFKYNGSQREYDLKRAKNSFLNFINELNKRGDELIGNYTMLHKDTIIKIHKCGHSTLLSPKRYVYDGNGCGVCHGTQILIGYNDIATTHPHLVKYFVNIEDVYNYTYGSSKKVMMKCPHCGHEKVMFISNLVRHGFGCGRCGDGVSYPEKVIVLILETLEIQFKKQYKFDNYKRQYKYDFYLTDLDIIIEVHGGQHYKDGTGYMKTYEEEHENDMYKYDLAVLHGYEYNKNYFVIDARESNIEWLKNNIEQCNLFEQFDLSNVDWQEIDIKSQKSLKIEVCKYWQENKEVNKDLTTVDVAKEFKVDKNTIVRYLKWGSENGFCNYDPKEETKIVSSRKTNKRKKYWVSLGEAVYFINDKKEIVCRADSVEELSRLTGINAISLRRVLREKQPLKAGNRSTYDKKYKGYCVVLAEEYDLQFNKENSDSKQLYCC